MLENIAMYCSSLLNGCKSEKEIHVVEHSFYFQKYLFKNKLNVTKIILYTVVFLYFKYCKEKNLKQGG